MRLVAKCCTKLSGSGAKLIESRSAERNIVNVKASIGIITLSKLEL